MATTSEVLFFGEGYKVYLSTCLVVMGNPDFEEDGTTNSVVGAYPTLVVRKDDHDVTLPLPEFPADPPVITEDMSIEELQAMLTPEQFAFAQAFITASAQMRDQLNSQRLGIEREWESGMRI